MGTNFPPVVDGFPNNAEKVIFETYDWANGRLTLDVNSTNNGFELSLQFSSDGSTWVRTRVWTFSGSMGHIDIFPPKDFRIVLKNTSGTTATMTWQFNAHG